MTSIFLTTDEYIFDDLEELKNCKTTKLQFLKLFSTCPYVNIEMGSPEIKKRIYIFVDGDNSRSKGLFHSLCDIVSAPRLRLKHLYRIIINSIVTGLVSFSTGLIANHYFRGQIVLSTSIQGVISIATIVAQIFYFTNGTSIHLKYRIDNPGFFQSKGDDVRSKILIAVISPVFSATFALTIAYYFGHVFGPTVPVSPAVGKK